MVNRFFGETITVSGLITGRDLIEQLKGKALGERLLIPDSMLRAGERIFLDDVTVEQVEDDYYVTLDHPMSKGHFLSFVAYLTTDRVLLQKTYPEQAAAVRFPRLGPGQILAYCNRHGLFRKKIS